MKNAILLGFMIILGIHVFPVKPKKPAIKTLIECHYDQTTKLITCKKRK